MNLFTKLLIGAAVLLVVVAASGVIKLISIAPIVIAVGAVGCAAGALFMFLKADKNG